MRLLVTGGAGYIGSVTVARLLEGGHDVTVIDDLSTGHREALPDGCRFVHARIQDGAAASDALAGVEAVVHFASKSLVGESMERPDWYHEENVGGLRALLEAMDARGVTRIVFSSSAAVYGVPDADVITEDHALAPVNPYGETKAAMERLLAERCGSGDFAAIALRYFNAAGATPERGEDHAPETHLIPRLLGHALGTVDDFAIHGGDYPTPDGSAIRDYVHVLDLADAHVAALTALEPGRFEALNLGTGHGLSVREILGVAQRVTGMRFSDATGPRRAGDPPRLVASRERAAARLGWTPGCSDPERILRDAWEWHRAHPDGYAG